MTHPQVGSRRNRRGLGSWQRSPHFISNIVKSTIIKWFYSAMLRTLSNGYHLGSRVLTWRLSLAQCRHAWDCSHICTQYCEGRGRVIVRMIAGFNIQSLYKHQHSLYINQPSLAVYCLHYDGQPPWQSAIRIVQWRWRCYAIVENLPHSAHNIISPHRNWCLT